MIFILLNQRCLQILPLSLLHWPNLDYSRWRKQGESCRWRSSSPVRSERPSAGGGRPGRRHGDGADLHGPEERREAGQDLADHHQVESSVLHRRAPTRPTFAAAFASDCRAIVFYLFLFWIVTITIAPQIVLTTPLIPPGQRKPCRCRSTGSRGCSLPAR